MLLSILKSKIHRAVVTETDIDYVGSITIDESLMKAVGIVPFEEVHVWNISNGSRLITYAIPAAPESCVICLNGAAAHLNKTGDRVIIASFAALNEHEVLSFKPKIAIVNSNNKIDRFI